MSGRTTKFALIAGALAVAFSGAVAFGDTPTGGQVNLSGATLFREWFSHTSSTNDFINADLDSVWGFSLSIPPVEQLANPVWGSGNPAAPSYWWFSYRAVGSGTGLQDLRYFYNGLTSAALSGKNWSALANPTDNSYINTHRYYQAAGPIAPYAGSNPGGMPYAIDSIDVAVMDVPTLMMLQDKTSAGAWNQTPGLSGYGSRTNPSPVYGQANNIKDLTPLNLGANALPVPHAVDNQTVFDTQVAWAPVAFVANPGTGLQNVKLSDLQYMYVTGRTPTGANLQVATRDPGSGTRNAAMNSIGVDPSWGPGDNFGPKTPDAATDLTKVGAAHQTGNCAGTSVIKAVVQNTRLGVGYVGAIGDSNGMVTGKQAEVLNVMKDTAGGTSYVRPSLTAVLNNGDVNTGWQIGGAETFITVGDPRATIKPVYTITGVNQATRTFTVTGNYRGLLFQGDQIAVTGTNAGTYTVVSESYSTTVATQNVVVQQAIPSSTVDGTLTLINNNPVMLKAEAAKYVLNILSSINYFVANPDATADNLMPAQDLATTFILNAAVDTLPTPASPTTFGTNAGEVQAVQDYILANNTWSEPAFGTAAAGQVPTRVASADYPYAGDNSTTGSYTEANGTTLSAGANLNTRNRLAGNFSNSPITNAAGNSSCSLNDIDGLMQALAAPGTVPASDLCVQIVGDINGDGDFDKEDARYFADGLAIDPATGKLNRKQGFILVDQKSAAHGGPANYFGTTLSTGKPYTAGDSRADVTENPSLAKTGAITAVLQAASNSHRSTFTVTGDFSFLHRGKRVAVAGWTNDGSGLNNNGKYSIVGVTFAAGSSTVEVFEDLPSNVVSGSPTLAYTPYNQPGGQPTGDGVIDQADVDYVTANVAKAAANLAAYNTAHGTSLALPAWGDAPVAFSLSVYAGVDLSCDINGDGKIDQADVNEINGILGRKTDINMDGYVNVGDLQLLVAQWGKGPGYAGREDINGDGYVNVGDLQMLVADWGAHP